VILATQQAEIRWTTVQNQLKQFQRPCLEKKSQKSAGGVAQGVGPEFKPQYHKKKRKKSEILSQKSLKHKKVGGMAQVVGHLPSKYEFLKSIHSTTHTKKIKDLWGCTSTCLVAEP
jgi:hypothetical protein